MKHTILMKTEHFHSLKMILNPPFFAADIYDKVSGELEKLGPLDCECVGGGRIKHDTQAKKIHVYGYSMVRENQPDY